MKGLLLRVGIDQAFGEWNAPVDPDTLEFVYLPIPDDIRRFHAGLETSYDSFAGYLQSFAQGRESDISLSLPSNLTGRRCHLDPDFDYLTYGDQPIGRGKKVSALDAGDFIAFFAGLKPIRSCEHNLVYGLIGIYFVKDVTRVKDIPSDKWSHNAHTRRDDATSTDVVVIADETRSGRFKKCIPIGVYRNGAYRVRKDLLDEWNGLETKDGFIQRSVNPPWFSDPEAFLTWLKGQESDGLLSSNN